MATMNLQKLYARGWTLTQAARQLNVAVSTVSRVLSGEKKIPRIMTELAALPQRTLRIHPARTNKQTKINIH